MFEYNVLCRYLGQWASVGGVVGVGKAGAVWWVRCELWLTLGLLQIIFYLDSPWILDRNWEFQQLGKDSMENKKTLRFTPLAGILIIFYLVIKNNRTHYFRPTMYTHDSNDSWFLKKITVGISTEISMVSLIKEIKSRLLRLIYVT